MSELTRLSTTTGLFPLPDRAKHTLKEQKGRQRDDLIHGSEGPSILEEYNEARKTVIDWQHAAGLDRTVEGQLRWDDMLAHPLAVHDSVTTGGLRRYYDNNNFYREVTVKDELTPDGDIAQDLEQVTAGSRQAVLPGPISLADLATNEYYRGEESFLQAIASFLAAEITALPDVNTAMILEPSITAARNPFATDAALDALETVLSATNQAGIDDSIVQPYWGVPSEEIYAGLLEFDDVAIGFDLISNHSASVELLVEYGSPATVSLGVVDGQNTRIESPVEIERHLARIQDTGSDIERAYLTLNTEGFYLPTNRFREKLGVLATASEPTEVPQ